MLKRILSTFGSDGPTVDTVLHTPVAMPGQVLAGRVVIQGGPREAVVDQVALSLVTQATVWLGGHRVDDGCGVRPPGGTRERPRTSGDRVEVPFEVGLPWETPITAVGEAVLPGMTVGLRTALVVGGTPDEGDLDLVLVRPLASQDRVLEGVGELGATFDSAGVAAGRMLDVPHERPFYQEIVFTPPPALARPRQVELTFVATPDDPWVILEADRVFRPTADAFASLTTTHEEAADAHRPTLLWERLTAD